ncbi:hypothetical protein [Streptomyces alkaliterrae]|uniref:Uncharacterized protein n=1 Tax=Streptomyces alkaliterrae TaxID=2213162 RepID=A0A5P0YUA1_9ACTN|nr:hypothetical protein [Streptomyces alkaliterrae]MBB1254881.1 hypothetical protein [Streptomyces alkaliterrae]MBB1262026.1 hypothetical protein [Streptomyces alkaliterrae]MQS03197.1 hypothetical protein [Streptomyces alkaliterrae]
MTTEPTRYSTPPVELPLRWRVEPVPVPDCSRCAALAAHRERARATGDLAAVTDCNVRLRRHAEGHR